MSLVPCRTKNGGADAVTRLVRRRLLEQRGIVRYRDLHHPPLEQVAQARARTCAGPPDGSPVMSYTP